MHLSPTSRQMICLFCAVVSLYCCVFGESRDKIKIKTCCPRVSSALVKGEILKCAHLRPKRKCLEAYVLVTEKGQYCFSGNAKWLNATLAKLEKEGKPCIKM